MGVSFEVHARDWERRSMRSRVRLVVAFVAGVLVGGVAMGFVGRRSLDYFLRTWLVTNTFEETLTLQELERGGPERYKKRVFGHALPGLAESLAQRNGEPEVDSALWAIRRAYEREGLELPARVAPHVRDLPPEAEITCRKRYEEIEAKEKAAPPAP
jgi:hypothetical protein